MFEDVRRQNYNNLAMQSAVKILNSTNSQSEINGFEVWQSIQEQKQPMIEYLNNERLLDLLESGITEMLNGQEINVVLDGKEVGQEIVRQMIKK